MAAENSLDKSIAGQKQPEKDTSAKVRPRRPQTPKA
jgi:hypothetical protein